MLRSRLSDVSMCTATMLSSGSSSIKNLQSKVDVCGLFMNCMCSFMQSAIVGPPLRVECVIECRTIGEIISQVDTYGARMVQFVLREHLVGRSIKSWPTYVHNTGHEMLERLRTLIGRINHTVSTIIKDFVH